MAKRKRYTVQARLDLFAGIEVLAESLEDAVSQAKALNYDDFVTKIHGTELIDAGIEITGVLN